MKSIHGFQINNYYPDEERREKLEPFRYVSLLFDNKLIK